MNPTILSEEPLCMSDVQAHLAAIKKRDGELNFRANRTEENINAVLEITHKKAQDLKKALLALEIPRLKDIHVCKIVDVLPRSNEEVKVILQGYTITVTNENIKKIIDSISEIVPQKK